MHELAIAESIVKTVHNEIEKNGLGRVVAVGMRIGALTDVVPDALEFGFEAIIRDTVLDGAKIVIESIPIQGRCRSCGGEFEVMDFAFICPDCHSREIELIRGNELDLAYIEVADTDDAGS
ncbi:MAG: hydrogenase maturation nickel metallochaperone HypA [candidate division Zixibacteria bacterium]|nr:hydrogenase maturation nickel metallochaperone HypA [candidate division Zixibacteria bacterium]